MARTRASTLEFINEIFPTGIHLFVLFMFHFGALDFVASVPLQM